VVTTGRYSGFLINLALACWFKLRPLDRMKLAECVERSETNRIGIVYEGFRYGCFKFYMQTYSFDNSLSVDRSANLQLESWLGSFNRLALVLFINRL
jgi:hypothetical protein